MCSKQKSDVPNDVTSDLAAMRCMSDIVFAAVSSQVCRKEGEEKAGKQGHVFLQASPAAIHEATYGHHCAQPQS